MAQRAHRTGAERERLLDAALQQFVTARAAAPDGTAAVDSELLVAACWLAKGSLADFDLHAQEAADLALAEIHQLSRTRSATPEGNGLDAPAPSRPAGGWAKWRSTKPENIVTRTEGPTRSDLATLFNRVQDLRRCYGAAPAAAPRLLDFFSPWRRPEFGDGPQWGNDAECAVLEGLAGASTAIHIVDVASAKTSGPWVVEAIIAPALAPDTTVRATVARGREIGPFNLGSAESMGPGPLPLSPRGLPWWHGGPCRARDLGARAELRLWSHAWRPLRIVIAVEGSPPTSNALAGATTREPWIIGLYDLPA